MSGAIDRIRGWVTTPKREHARGDRVASRSFRYIACQIASDFGNSGGGIVLLSAGCAAEVAVEMALMLAASLAAEADARVLLVDSSFRGGELSRRLRAADASGLVQLVDGSLEMAPLVRQLAVPRVFFLPLGQQAGLATRANPDAARAVLTRLRAAYDIVLLVQRPIGSDTRNIVFAAAADLVLLVAEESVSRLEELAAAEAVFRTHGIANVRLLLSQPSEPRKARAG